MTYVKKVAMIILMQPDLDAAVTFYKELGFTLIFHIKETWAEFDLKGVKICLCPTPKPVSTYHTGFVFEVTDVAALYADLSPRFTFMGEPTKAATGMMVSIKDPGGNIIDFYQSHAPLTAELFGYENRGQHGGCCTPKPETCCKSEKC